MAKPIVVSYQGAEAKFDHQRVDRAKLYGRRRRIPLDPEGKACQRADLSDDGSVLVSAGMTSQGYFDKGDDRWIPTKELVGLDGDDKPVERRDSTLGVAQEAKLTDPETLLDLQVLSVYMLDKLELPDALATELAKGSIFTFPFNYRADFHAETAFLLENEEGYFAIVGNPTQPAWLSLEQVIEESATEDDEDADDLDFEMF